MQEIKAYDYCQETLAIKGHIESSYLVLCQRLHKIKNERLYEGHYDSWGLFLEEMKLDKFTAERMIKIYDTFVLKYSISPAKIEGAGGWSVVAELLPISNSKKEAEEALDYATGALKKDVRVYVQGKRYGTTEDSKMCRHKDCYSVTVCRDCKDRWQVHGVDVAIDRLKELQKNADKEGAHVTADEILVQLLTELGLSKVVKEYEKIDKWFA